MKRTRYSLLLAVWLAGQSMAQVAPDTVLIDGAGQKITAGDVYAAIAGMPAQERASLMQDKSQLATLVNDMYIRRVLAQQARAQGLDKEATNKVLLQLAEDRALSELALIKIDNDSQPADAKVTEQARALYNKEGKSFNMPELISASHILVRSGTDKEAARKKAEGLLARVKGGGDFEAIARENSDDPGSSHRGGSLGWFQRGRMVKPFEDALFKLKPGETSGVVESEFGYHIIRLHEIRPAGKRPFDEVRGPLELQVRQQAVQDARKREAERLLKSATLRVDGINAVVNAEPKAAAGTTAKPAAPTKAGSVK